MRIDSNKIKYFRQKLWLFAFINLFLIFRIEFLFLPNFLQILSVLGLGLAIIKNYKKNAENIIMLLFMLSIMLVWALFSIFANTGEFMYFKKLLAVIYKFGLAIISIWLFRLFFGAKANILIYLKTFVLSCVLLLLTTFILISSEQLNLFWVGHVVDRNPLLDQGYFTRISIIGFTGFDEVSVFSISYFCCAFILSYKIDHRKSVFLWLSTYVILIIGGLLYGRVSILAALLSFIFLCIITKNKFKIVKISITLIAVFAISFLLLSRLSLYNENLNSWYRWAFEFVNLFTGKSSSIGSVDVMFSMYRFPSSLKTWLIGDGKLTWNGLYYQETDIGFIRTIYFYGIIGLVLTYGFFILLLYLTANQTKDRKIKSLLLFILIAMLVFELKALAWDNYLFFIFSIFIFSMPRNIKGGNRYAIKRNCSDLQSRALFM